MMALIDYFVILLFFLVLLYIGRLAAKRVLNNKDYLLAGKRVGKIPLALSMAATDLGGAGVVGAMALSYSRGIAGGWWNFCAVPAWIILGLTIPKLFIKQQTSTVPELLEKRYDLRTRILAAILHLIGTTFAITAQTMVAAMIITSITGIPMTYSVLAATVVFVVYTTAGGLIAVIWTDIFAYFVLIFGVVIALGFSISKVGSISTIVNSVPKSFWSVGNIGWMEPAAWIVMNLFFYSTSQPYIQRLIAAKDANTAKFAYVYTGINYIISALFIALLGICSYIIIPGLKNAEMAVTSIINYALPVGVRGVMLASILAATMTTSSSYLNACASIFTIDIYKRIINPRANDIKCLKAAKLSTLGISLIALMASYFAKGIIEMIVFANIIYTACIFFPLLVGLKSKKVNSKAEFYSIIIGGMLAVISKLWIYKVVEGVIGVIHPIFVGSIVSLLVLIFVSLITKNTDKNKRGEL